MKRRRKSYSKSMKEEIMNDYFSSKMSQAACARKWQIHPHTLQSWISSCKSCSSSVSLHVKSKKTMDVRDEVIARQRSEIERLERELEYQKLKTTAYERLIEIVKLEDGIDVLKKDGAKR